MHRDFLNVPTLRHCASSQPVVDTSAGVDLARVVSGAAQQALSAARERGLQILFDYTGPALRTLDATDGDAIRTVADYLLAWIIRRPAEDFVSFTARAHWLSPARCRFCITAANADLGLHEAIDDPQASAADPLACRVLTSALTLAANVCRSRHACFALENLRGDRWRARAEFSFDCFDPAPDATARLAPPQEAWLVGSPPRAMEAMARRLHRRGWGVRLFELATNAVHALEADTQAGVPGLVVTAEPLGSRREGVVALRNRLPPACTVAWLIDVNEHLGRSPQAGVILCAMPMAEAQLAALAHRVGVQNRGPGPTPGPRSDGDFVLVVDDNEINRELATAMLAWLGYDSETAIDGSDAVDRCLTRPPGAVLMDLRMPRMNGFDATRKLRQLQREGIVASFPILAVTADIEGLDRLEWARAGMDSVLTKPMDLRALGERLSAAIANYSMGPP